MQGLSSIQGTVMQVADAITAALDIETEIVDDKLKIIGGTGRYINKIGSYEEEGDLDSDCIYASILRKGNEYICMNTRNDLRYDQKEGELAEISCPIIIESKIIGIIGLIAFNNAQQEQIIKKSEQYLNFLRRMSDLIGSKLLESQNHNKLIQMFESAIRSGYATGFENIVGSSSEIMDAIKRAKQVAPNDSTILITGESGTGKELFARAIHSESHRKDEPFISINCGAIPEALLESELFGYEKGAFTGANVTGKLGKFELAHKGTVFLDEVGDMPLHLQVKILHVLQNRTIERVGGISQINVDLRIIAATNKDLESMILKGEFREDLFFRLNVIPIVIPPLRKRRGDVEILMNRAIERFSLLLGKSINGFEEDAFDIMLDYEWPGNVRELENAIEYSVNMATGNKITKENLPVRIKDIKGLFGNSGIETLKAQTDKAQIKIINDCLMKTGKSLQGKRKAANILGVSETTLYRRMRQLNMKG